MITRAPPGRRFSLNMQVVSSEDISWALEDYCKGYGARHLLFLNAGWGVGKLIEVAVRGTFCF